MRIRDNVAILDLWLLYGTILLYNEWSCIWLLLELYLIKNLWVCKIALKHPIVSCGSSCLVDLKYEYFLPQNRVAWQFWQFMYTNCIEVNCVYWLNALYRGNTFLSIFEAISALKLNLMQHVSVLCVLAISFCYKLIW